MHLILLVMNKFKLTRVWGYNVAESWLDHPVAHWQHQSAEFVRSTNPDFRKEIDNRLMTRFRTKQDVDRRLKEASARLEFMETRCRGRMCAHEATRTGYCTQHEDLLGSYDFPSLSNRTDTV